MAVRDSAVTGAPCWADLMTSDVETTRAFYGAVFGWTADEPDGGLGGYFNFRLGGMRIAGCMASQPGAPVTDVWSVYLASEDAQKSVDAAQAEGGQVHVSPMTVRDLGTMAFVADPGGAGIGIWQPGTHQGFGRLDEPGAPSWFELHTRSYEQVLAFYRNVFGWETKVESDTEDFRYTTLQYGDQPLAGVMDASVFLPAEAPPCWSVYWAVESADRTAQRIVDNGGSLVHPPHDTPYGRLVEVQDPHGAAFKLREA
ncbi:MAG TPA: VOC family protein [Mycobacteriales bacterium]|nr:VOC family protein [Mycobacteriales bacterium]